MSGQIILGMNCHAYRNTGSYASPTWSEIDDCNMVTLGLTRGEVDSTTRADVPWETVMAALIKAEVALMMPWNPTDTNFAAMLAAFLAGTAIEVAIMDGPIATIGSKGLRASVIITEFPREEPLNDMAKSAVKIKPTPSANKPAWFTVSA